MLISCNLNDKIYFKPTDKGKAVYKEYLDSIKITEIYPDTDWSLKVDGGGYAYLQLWDFMNIYGKYVYIGTTDYVIEDMNVFIDTYNDQSRRI